jgi:hypothetical protein
MQLSVRLVSADNQLLWELRMQEGCIMRQRGGRHRGQPAQETPPEGYVFCDLHNSCFHSGCLRGACGDGTIGPNGHCGEHDNDCHMEC